MQSRACVFVVDDAAKLRRRLLKRAGLFAAAHDLEQRIERVEDSRQPVDRGAGRRNAAQQPVQLVVFTHDGLVEPFDVRAAVILRGQDAVMLELDHRLLYRHAAES